MKWRARRWALGKVAEEVRGRGGGWTRVIVVEVRRGEGWAWVVAWLSYPHPASTRRQGLAWVLRAWRGRGCFLHAAPAHHGTTVTVTVSKRGKNASNCRGLDPQESSGGIRHSVTESPSAFRLARTRNKNGSGASQSLVYYRISDGRKC